MASGKQVARAARLNGRISDWNDERGFGFVTPTGGGDRAFVHVNAFARGSRRPGDGDVISYLPVTDARGRLQARAIRHAGQKAGPHRQRARLPRAVIGLIALLVVVAAAATDMVPVPVAGWYLSLSLVSYAMYAIDKRSAKCEARRTPESSLHLVDLLGGWPGALMAQQQFRHKTGKYAFQIMFWTTVVLNLAGFWWLRSSGRIAEWTRLLIG